MIFRLEIFEYNFIRPPSFLGELKVPVGDMILSVLTSLVDVPPASPLRATVGGRGSRRAPREQVLSNLFLVLLFTLYLLLGGGGAESHGVNAEADAQVLSYIKGKVLISLGVGVATALILLAVGLDLWLVFGVMAFWLNFIPNVGSMIAMFLPTPVVLLDPALESWQQVMAFVGPGAVQMCEPTGFPPCNAYVCCPTVAPALTT